MTQGRDPLSAQFIFTPDPNTGRPAFFFFATGVESRDVSARSGEAADSIPALLCTIWRGDDGSPVAVTIRGEDASGERHVLSEHFREVGVRIDLYGSAHLELAIAPAVGQERGAGTLFLDGAGRACFFRLDVPARP